MVLALSETPVQLVSLEGTHGGTAPAARRYELDWLRAFVVLGVTLYHVAGFFAAGTTLDPLDVIVPLALQIPNLFFNAWAIPLLFAISGAASCFALRRSSPSAYLGSRAGRLVVPFLFGTLVLVPLQVYGVLLGDPGLLRLSQVPVSDPHPLASYPHFYVLYLHSYWYFLGHYSSQLEFVFWGHLWFISRLVACVVLTLPLLVWLNTGQGKRVIALVVRCLQWPPAMVLPGLAAGGAIVLLHQPGAVSSLGSWSTLDWSQFAVLLLCYLMGYMLCGTGGIAACARLGEAAAIARGHAAASRGALCAGDQALRPHTLPAGCAPGAVRPKERPLHTFPARRASVESMRTSPACVRSPDAPSRLHCGHEASSSSGWHDTPANGDPACA